MKRRPDRCLVVSVTTVPWRIRFLDSVLHNLLAQSFNDFELHVYIPYRCQRSAEPYELPASLLALERSESRLQLRRLATDYGPATKLLGPFLEHQDAQTSGDASLITVDDDVELERHAIEELVEATARYPEDALGFMGVSENQYIHAETLAAHGLADFTPSILGGYRAVLYPLRSLDASLLEDYDGVTDRCQPFLDDDHLIAWNLSRRGITRRVIATRYPGRDFGLNFQFLNLPGPITSGEDGGPGVLRSHRRLIDYYRDNGWAFPR